MATTLHVSADARPEIIRALRNVVASFARESGLADAQVFAVKFCVSEAVSNAVEHAYPESEPGPVEVSAQEVGDELAVVVEDHGRVHHDGKRSEDEGGFGLPFIARLTDGCTFTAAGDGTTVEMRFPLPRSKATSSSPGVGDALLHGRARVLRHA
jgi:serine/threonine-protein kinase RsbW